MATKVITLEFKKEDFNQPYMNSLKCPITKALERVGLGEYCDSGVCIRHKTKCLELRLVEPKQYQAMVNLVLGVYSTVEDGDIYGNDGIVQRMPLCDFSAELEIILPN